MERKDIEEEKIENPISNTRLDICESHTDEIYVRRKHSKSDGGRNPEAGSSEPGNSTLTRKCTKEVKSELRASGGIEYRTPESRNRTYTSLKAYWEKEFDCDGAKGYADRQPRPRKLPATPVGEKTRKDHFTGNDQMSVEEGKRIILRDRIKKLSLLSTLPARTGYLGDEGYTPGERRRATMSYTATRAREMNNSRQVQPRFVDTFNMEVKELVQNVCCGSDELLDDDIIIVRQPNEQRHLNIGERFGRLPIFNEPQHLILTGSRNNFVINNAAMKQINSIDLPMSIVSICGLYRTGKSYLLNKLANEKRGFKVGHGVSSETKGIWAWCKPHPKQKDTVLLLLDIEGMADIKKGSEVHDNDIKLFCLANLLSSTIIYNHRGVFDQDALEKLSFITRMTENVRNTGNLSPDVNDETLRLLTPTFVMCLRDFHLRLEDGNRSFNNADEYFESAIELSEEPGHESNNKTKECIHKYYPNRKCIIIPQPALNSNLAKLEDLDEKDLDKDFLNGLNELKEFIYDRKPKVLDAVTNKVADGLAFEAFTRTYVRALEKGETMTFTSAFIQASKFCNGKLCVQITQEYRKEVAEIKLPFEKKEDLQHQCFMLKRRKLEIFRSQAYPYFSWQFEDEAMAKMKDIENEKMNENTKKVQAFFAKILESIHIEQVGGFELDDEAFLKMENSFLLKTRGWDNDEQAAAFFKFKKKTKAKEAEIAAKLQEENEKQEILRRQRQHALQRKLEDQRLKIKQEREKAMKKELDKMKQNYTNAMGRHAIKGKPWWSRFIDLLKWRNFLRN